MEISKYISSPPRKTMLLDTGVQKKINHQTIDRRCKLIKQRTEISIELDIKSRAFYGLTSTDFR